MQRSEQTIDWQNHGNIHEELRLYLEVFGPLNKDEAIL